MNKKILKTLAVVALSIVIVSGYLCYIRKIETIRSPDVVGLTADFESPDQFLFIKPTLTQSRPQTYFFQSESSWWTTGGGSDTESANIRAANSVIRSLGTRTDGTGSYVAKFRLDNPVDDGRRRIHIRHLWDPMATEDILGDFWVYFPTDFPINAWTEFFAMVSERIWDVNNNPLESFGLGMSIIPDGQNADGSYKIQVGLNMLQTQGYGLPYHTEPEKYLRTVGGVCFGSWNHIAYHVHRPVTAIDPTLEKAGGYFEVWIGNVLQEWKTLGWHGNEPSGSNCGTRVICRTCGEKPSVLATYHTTSAYTLGVLNFTRGWLESGPDLYSGDLPALTAKELLFDDVTLNSSLKYPRETRGESILLDISAPDDVGRTEFLEVLDVERAGRTVNGKCSRYILAKVS